ncbi:hypothetical protein KXQ82_14805 [Mucilaginibacter sp. HMF5004]|uniref:hypothetical protein n=1 Tax=Mucilaginibacter rivuli TaxID=2857527 RepID=UPI001C5D4499|nr:hypothetical protein [Mucilaginibacter rivuli]MBW4890995.1 hypothetical protein [Mucilaginibacter rivuli]
MKKSALLILAFVLCTAVYAQSIVPTIKGNSVITYTYTLNGQDLPLTLTFNSLGDPIKIDWSIEGIGSGNYEMSSKALAEGKGVTMKAPDPDQLTKLPTYETVACISRSAYAEMVKNMAFEYDDLKFTVTKDSTGEVKMGDKTLDVYHAVATNGKGEMWILNNPDFPLICKTKDNAQGTDLMLVSIQ